MQSRLLVFGATGYVGGHAARWLHRSGHEITAVVRTESAAAKFGDEGIEAIVADAREIAFDRGFLERFDGVLWAAQLMLEDEERVCSAMIRALRDTDKTFVFTSGTSLISEPTNGEWSENSYSEFDDFLPRRQIAPRLSIETMVRVAAHSGVRAMVVRPPLVWGHGGCRIIEELYHSVWKTGAACYVGSGLNLYTHVHVDDLCELYRLAFLKGVPGALYHLASGEVNFRTMAQAISSKLGVEARSITVEDAAGVWDRFVGPIIFSGCSRTRAPRSRQELGWMPSLGKRDILEECVAQSYAVPKERKPPSFVRQT